MKYRKTQGRKAKTSFCIADAQSVKNTDCAKNKGYDAGEKISGIKRHISTDIIGLSHAITVTTANITDRNGEIEAITKNMISLSMVKSIMVDAGYATKPFADTVNELLGATVKLQKRSELHTFKVIPKRWVVERSFAWLEKCRRLWKNTERKPNTSLQFVVLAFLVILLKRL
jgi:transposase